MALVAFVTYRELPGGCFRRGAGGIPAPHPARFFVLRGARLARKVHLDLRPADALLPGAQLPLRRLSRRLAAHVLLFYLAFWGMAAGNVFFAATFMFAIALSLALGWGYERLFLRTSPAEATTGDWWRRLLLVAITCLVIVFLFINYAYPPSLQIYFFFKNLADKIFLLFLGAEPIAESGSFQYLGDAWRSQPAYLVLTGVQWAISLSSLAAGCGSCFACPGWSPSSACSGSSTPPLAPWWLSACWPISPAI